MASQGPNPRTAKRTTHTSPAVQFNPNPQQADAIAHMNGPAAFIAAAGTGKTAILVQRLAPGCRRKDCATSRSLPLISPRTTSPSWRAGAGRPARGRGTPAAAAATDGRRRWPGSPARSGRSRAPPRGYRAASPRVPAAAPRSPPVPARTSDASAAARSPAPPGRRPRERPAGRWRTTGARRTSRWSRRRP